jgi:phosphate transport system substrate-binding protein
MKAANCTLLLLTFALLVGCSDQLTPSTPPNAEARLVRLFATDATLSIAERVVAGYQASVPDDDSEIIITQGGHANLMERVRQDADSYLLSLHSASGSGVDLWSAPLARDGIAIIVNPLNPVTSLQSDDVRRIYQGFVTNWADFGGADAPIVVYSRESSTDVRLEFERLVMGRRLMTPNARVVPSIEALLTSIANDPGGIGYVPYSGLTDAVRPLAIDGAVPTRETIASNRYALRSTLFIIGQQAPDGPYLDLINWMQGAGGRGVIEQQYVPLALTPTN